VHLTTYQLRNVIVPKVEKTKIRPIIFLIFSFFTLSMSNTANAALPPKTTSPYFEQQTYIGTSSGVSDVLFDGVDDGVRLGVYIGHDVAPQVALEVGVIQLGEFDTTGNSSISVNGATVALRGENSLGGGTYIYMKVGFLAWQLDPSLYNSGTLLDTDKQSGTSLWGGFGISVNLGQHLSVWSGVDRYNGIDGVDINSLAGGFQFNF